MWTPNPGFSDNVYVQETFVHVLDSPELKMPLNTSTFSNITNMYLLKTVTTLL